MKLVYASVLLVLSSVACADSQSHGIPVAAPRRIGGVYLLPVFLPNQEEYSNADEIAKNGIDAEEYNVASPLHQIVLGYSPKGSHEVNVDDDQISSKQETVHYRQRRSPGGGRGGGGGGGRGGGGGGSGSWSRSSSSSSSGSWGSGSGGGRGFGGGKGKGHGK